MKPVGLGAKRVRTRWVMVRGRNKKARAQGRAGWYVQALHYTHAYCRAPGPNVPRRPARAESFMLAAV
ncbi:hypothetical protein Tamer19_53740 [Cupriavidus sp. TA19]|nr:hypothetical protein Tamer19_53740 [Cupriavidus sp. TA19]